MGRDRQAGPSFEGDQTMAGGTQGTGRTGYQIPDEMRTMAERSVTQARQALENYLHAARRTSQSMEQTSDKVQASSKDVAQKTLSAVEQNLRASLDYAVGLARFLGCDDRLDPVVRDYAIRLADRPA